MGEMRKLDDAEIRERALRQAARKYDEGCENCAEGYLSVAQQHGATPEDIERVALGRRHFLKIAGGLLAVGAAAAVVGKAVIADATQGTTIAPAGPIQQGYWGADSNTPLTTATVAGMPLHFYIGKLGATVGHLTAFAHDTAAAVGAARTHGYWGLAGPASSAAAAMTAPSGAIASGLFASAHSAASVFGQQQAMAAISAWGAAGIQGRTIFADVEAGFDGWGDSVPPEQCAQLLDGFLATIAAEGFEPGVYINNSSRGWFPGNYRAAVPFVYWTVAGVSQDQLCPPCAQGCDTLSSVAQEWQQTIAQTTFAGQSAIVWQYWPSDFGCNGDYNFSPQSGYNSFTPAPVPRE